MTTPTITSPTTFEVSAETWDEMVLDTHATPEEEDGLSDSSSQEAIQVLQVWQQEEEAEETAGVPGEEDLIMQLEADEGLLPSLNDFYDSISATDTMPPEELFSDAVVSGMALVIQEDDDAIMGCDDGDHHSNHSDSFFSAHSSEQDENKSKILQDTLQKLTESMKRSQETRQYLYAKTPKLQDYKRLGSVEKVLKSIEFSSYQIDTWYSGSLSARASTI